MLIRNTRLILSSCEFSSNGVLLQHSQIAADNCTSASVHIDKCIFKNDIDSQPVYKPGVELAGCDMLELTIENSWFQTAPVVVITQLHGHVGFNNVSFSGVSLRGSSLDITLGPGEYSSDGWNYWTNLPGNFVTDWLIEQGLTSQQTHYRSYRGSPHQQCQSTEGNQLVLQIRLEFHHVTIIEL